MFPKGLPIVVSFQIISYRFNLTLYNQLYVIEVGKLFLFSLHLLLAAVTHVAAVASVVVYPGYGVVTGCHSSGGVISAQWVISSKCNMSPVHPVCWPTNSPMS